VKVYLLHTDDGRHLFYWEGREQAHADHPPSPGIRGWFDRKAAALKEAWSHSEHGLVAKVRHVWHWLERKTDADEPMLSHLRIAPTIEVHHPSSMSSETARQLWSDYLTSRRRRHLPWLGVNALISPLTVVLAPLPGPNVVGYWFAYRAVRNLLAVLGLRRARRADVDVTFHPNEALNRPVEELGGGLSGLLDPAGEPGHLEDFLERSGVAKPDLTTGAHR
jgi:hypothetical protein